MLLCLKWAIETSELPANHHWITVTEDNDMME